VALKVVMISEESIVVDGLDDRALVELSRMYVEKLVDLDSGKIDGIWITALRYGSVFESSEDGFGRRYATKLSPIGRELVAAARPWIAVARLGWRGGRR